MKRLYPLALSLLLAGCAALGPAAEPPAPLPEPEPKAAPAPQWQREALGLQPRLQEYREQIPADLGWQPDATEWHALPLGDEAELIEAGTPGRLLHKLSLQITDADLLGIDIWEQTLRVWQDGESEAVGIILQWGFKDDAIAGRDLRIHMRLHNNLWQAVELEERFHCRRGVTREGFCQ